VSPWLLSVLDFYIGASSGGILVGGLVENRNILLANSSIDSAILIMVLILIPTFLMFKSSRKLFIDNVSLLVVAWFLVPLIMTQSQIFGIYVDYPRFLYFIDFPGILITSATLFYIIRITSAIIKKYPKIRTHQTKKIVPSIFIASFFIFIILSPWSIYPGETIDTVDYYTTIERSEATALEWIQNNTAEASVFVADHLYGWWLSGVGERKTLSAAGLEFLLYQHEIEVAKSAKLLLDTDYYIDNGLIQVEDDGTYLSLHDPKFSIETWSGESYSLFDIQDSGIKFRYVVEGHENDSDPITTLADIKTVEMSVLMKSENSANLTMTFENDLFIIKKTLAVWMGVRFAKLSYDVEVKDSKTNLYNISLPIYTREGDVITDLSIPIFGFYDPDQKVCGQVIFKDDIPSQIDHIEDEPSQVRMEYRYPGKCKINITMLIGVFNAEDLSYPNEVEQMYHKLATFPLETVTIDPLVTFDYIDMIKEYDVSYVVSRDEEAQLKFLNDPNFRLLFNSGNVTIFQVLK
jgi:hypothetical protein